VQQHLRGRVKDPKILPAERTSLRKQEAGNPKHAAGEHAHKQRIGSQA